MRLLFIGFCTRHPRYKAVLRPRSDCRACLWLWNVAHPLSGASSGVLGGLLFKDFKDDKLMDFKR